MEVSRHWPTCPDPLSPIVDVMITVIASYNPKKTVLTGKDTYI